MAPFSAFPPRRDPIILFLAHDFIKDKSAVGLFFHSRNPVASRAPRNPDAPRVERKARDPANLNAAAARLRAPAPSARASPPSPPAAPSRSQRLVARTARLAAPLEPLPPAGCPAALGQRQQQRCPTPRCQRGPPRPAPPPPAYSGQGSTRHSMAVTVCAPCPPQCRGPCRARPAWAPGPRRPYRRLPRRLPWRRLPWRRLPLRRLPCARRLGQRTASGKAARRGRRRAASSPASRSGTAPSATAAGSP